MHTRLIENPFGTWNKIPELREGASLNEAKKFDLLWNETAVEDMSESEVSDYLQRLAEKSSVLNEYSEKGWFGVSPFAWTEGFKIGSIFKPLKWLALPLIGGVVLLLAGIWKLLKEGNKQIAIAKVRAWIEKLVVTADSGLKKTRNTKDSLFLIRQRYRRDILQNAVKVATCLGFDVEEKSTKPESVETSLNESSGSGKIRVDNIIYDTTSSGHRKSLTIRFDVNGIGVNVQIDLTSTQPSFYFPDYTYGQADEAFLNAARALGDQWDFLDKNVYEPIREKANNRQDIGIREGDVLEGGKFVHAESGEPGETPSNDDNLKKPEDPTDSSLVDNNYSENPAPSSIPQEASLPDDSRVDWSLMDSVSASQWFGLKHKTTNFWKEAKSVATIQAPDGNNDPLRFCGLLVSQVSMSLTLIANSGIAQSYASIMNKYIEVLTKIKTPDNIIKRDTRNLSGRFNSTREGAMETKYAMFRDDFKVFEALSQEDIELISSAEKDAEFQEWTEEVYGINARDLISEVNSGRASIDKLKSIYKEWKQSNYMLNWMVQYGNNMQQEIEDNMPSDQRNGRQGGVKLRVDQVDKYLIAALSKILANTNYNEWQVHTDAYNQMLKFINELTKTVHTIIDSVAKKVEDKIGGSGNTFEQAVLRFISSKPDAKQNRSLKNLWDNIGVSKLQQRTVVHCQEIVASPEMQYYLDMFMITVPSIIKSKIASVAQQQQQPLQRPTSGQQESNMGA